MFSNKWLVAGLLLFASACSCGEKELHAVRCEDMPDHFRVIFPEDYPVGFHVDAETDPAVHEKYSKGVSYIGCL